MLSANPDLDHFQVKQILKDTAIDLGQNGADNVYGAGRVDARRPGSDGAVTVA